MGPHIFVVSSTFASAVAASFRQLSPASVCRSRLHFLRLHFLSSAAFVRRFRRPLSSALPSHVTLSGPRAKRPCLRSSGRSVSPSSVIGLHTVCRWGGDLSSGPRHSVPSPRGRCGWTYGSRRPRQLGHLLLEYVVDHRRPLRLRSGETSHLGLYLGAWLYFGQNASSWVGPVGSR